MHKMENKSDEYRPLFDSELTDRPLFGVSNATDKIINMIVGCGSAVLILATLLSAFLAHWPPHGLNIYFALCICMICLSHVILIFWYRQGDLDPKFRLLIYYNAFTIILLSICALSFFFSEENPERNR